MRKHGWQLPYHPLQVVAIAVFLALGFSFYVFFLPFVGRKVFEYVVMGLYTPLVSCVFFLYSWCAATDPGDPGVCKSKKYLNIECSGEECYSKNVAHESSLNEAHAGNKPVDDCRDLKKLRDQLQKESSTCCNVPFFVVMLGCFPLSSICRWFHAHEQSSEKQTSEDGLFYCSLCEVEVLKYSKHCRVCDKCVDGFDHHCRWLNNCIGKRNYGRFFALMISALLLLILQWLIGVVVLILCFMERKRFSLEISAKLGNSFSLVPFIIVVASCTFLAMIATLPLAQLFFFHVLLIKKGFSTYDYIVALREQEQEQQGVGQQSPQMSSASSLTGFSSASSFNAFRRDAWCTPPRLFLEDQFDVVPPEVGKTAGKKMLEEDSTRKRSAGTVKISPWTLARLNAEEVSRAAEQAKKKSKILQAVTSQGHETDISLGSGRMVPRLDDTKRKRSKRDISSSLAPLQLAARSAFQTSRALSSTGIVASSPDSSLGSPDLHIIPVSSSGAAEDSRGLMQLPSGASADAAAAAAAVADRGIQLLRSTSSDGYEASGGEDSDQVPSKIVHRSFNWANLLFSSGRADATDGFKASSSSSSLSGLQSQIESMRRPL